MKLTFTVGLFCSINELSASCYNLKSRAFVYIQATVIFSGSSPVRSGEMSENDNSLCHRSSSCPPSQLAAHYS